MTPIGPMEAVISDIVFGPDGNLYGSSPTGDLYTIDPITGTKTLLFNTGIAQLSRLAAAPASPTPTANANGHSHSNSNSNSDCHCDGNSHRNRFAHGDTDTDPVRRKMYSDAAASSHSSASPIAPVAASLCEAETWDDCKRGCRVSRRRG